MVRSVTSLTGSGTKDWVLQRLSAIILAAYSLFLLGYVLAHQPLDFMTWHALFLHESMKIFTLLAIISLIAHAWVGMWTVFTDYITCAYGRAFIHVIVVLAFFACLLWSIEILWG